MSFVALRADVALFAVAPLYASIPTAPSTKSTLLRSTNAFGHKHKKQFLPFKFIPFWDAKHPEVDEGQDDIEPKDAEHIKSFQPHPAGRYIDHRRLDDPAEGK